MKYQVYFQHYLIASVEQDDSDFPTYFGRYQLAPAVDGPELAHVRDYIDYSVSVWPLIDQNRYDHAAMAGEEPYMDLIESNDWSLVESETHRRTLIMIPVFCSNYELNWRANPWTMN